MNQQVANHEFGKAADDETMSFLVCGMPRGGTTFFAQLFNVHESVYCYFMETAIVRQLHMFGHARPLPAENLGVLEKWLRMQLYGTLVEGTSPERIAKFGRLIRFRKMLEEHGLGEPSGPGVRVWDAAGCERLVGDLMELFRAGLHGPALMQAGLQVMAAHLRTATNRPILGEKTPDNLSYLDMVYAAAPATQVFCILREPYTTIASMRYRALKGETFFDSAFSKEIINGILGYYQSLATANEQARRRGGDGFHVLRYEDLLRDPAGIMGRAFDILGLGTTPAANELLPRLRHPSKRDKVADMQITPRERWLIDSILGPQLRYFGYEDLPVSDGHLDGCVDEMILPLRGIYTDGAPEAVIDHNWMARTAEIFFMVQPSRKKILIQMWPGFPGNLGEGSATLRATIDGKTHAEAQVAVGSGEFCLEIDLPGIDLKSAPNGMRAFTLRLESSLGFEPITVPGAGLDMRELSLLVKSCKLQ